MSVAGRILVNVGSNWLAMFTRGVIGILLVPFMLLTLGRAGYGLTALFMVIIAVSEIADLGLNNALARHLAAASARKDKQQFQQLLSSAATYYVGVGTLLFLCFVGVAPLVAKLFQAPPELFGEAVTIIRWFAGPMILLAFLRPIFVAALTSHSRFDLVNGVETALAIARGLLIWGALSLTSTGMYGWAGAMLASQIAAVGALGFIAWRSVPEFGLSFANVERSAFGKLFALGGYLFTFQLTGLLAVRSDPIVLTTFLGPAAVALYGPALMLSSAVRPFVVALSSQLHPLATGLHVTGDRQRLRAVLVRGTKYTVLMSLPLFVIMACFAEPITRLWLFKTLGPDYRTTAWVLMGWAVIDLFNHASGAQGPVLLGMNRLGFLVWTQLPLAVVNVICSVLLVGYTSLGVVGVIIPTVAITVLRRPIIIVYTARVCGLTAREYFVSSYLRPMVVLLPLTLLGVLLAVLVPIQSVAVLAICSLAVGAAWTVLCWWVGFNAQDRASLRVALGSVLTRMALPRRSSQAAGRAEGRAGDAAARRDADGAEMNAEETTLP